MFNKDQIQMYERQTNEALTLSSHLHNFYELIYVKSGRALFTVDDKSYEVASPAMLFISHIEHHGMQVTGVPYHTLYLMINKDTLLTLLEDAVFITIFKYRPQGFSHVIALEDEKAGVLFETLFTEYSKNDAFDALAFKAVLQYLFIVLYRKNSQHFPVPVLKPLNHIVSAVQGYIDGHFTERLSLDSLSKQFFLSPAHLSRSFKEITGYNLKEYIILQRLSKAKDLLKTSSLSVTETSGECGFNNLNAFIEAFKKYNGLTPSEYRKDGQSD